MFAGAAQPAEIREYLAETYELDGRAHGVYGLLRMRYLLTGPLERDEKRLARIGCVSLRVWRNTVWPALQEFFFPGDDGLIHHEELDRILSQDTAKARRSAAARKAAMRRWEEQKARDAAAAADANASPAHMQTHADAYANASGNSVFSMSDASTSDSKRMPNASAPSHAPSLSLSSESEVKEARERESAHPRADAFDDAQLDRRRSNASESHDANRMRTHADASKSHGAKTPIPPDWQPSEASVQEARKRGYDPDEMAASFRDWYVGNGERQADWDARFRTWLRREKTPPTRQPAMKLPIEGGAPSSADQELAAKLKPATDAWHADRNSCPLPPNLDDAKAPSSAAVVQAWLVYWAAWNGAGRPGDLKPPAFSLFRLRRADFDARMADIEEALTAPGPPILDTG